MAAASSASTSRVRASVSPALALAVLVVGATVVRLVLSLGRSMPRYLPDEYLYPQLARSIASGDGIGVLGHPSSFPAVLEPLLLAPVWGGLAPETALRVTQSLHALLIACAAIPVYAIARTVRLGDRAALLCAGAAVIAPGALYASLLTADALGYLLALITLALGVRALAEPSRSAQALFLLATCLAVASRLQYVVVVPAYLLAAWAVERRPGRAVRRHALVAGAAALGLAGLVLAGAGALGRYAAVTEFDASAAAVRWLASGSYLLVLATGIVLAPGAFAWAVSTVWSPQDRARTAFAVLGLGTIGATLVLSSVMTVETDSDRFLERYLIVAAPLTAVAFACWVAEGRRAKAVVVAAGLALIAGAALAPLSGWTSGQGVADSPTLVALARLEGAIGVGNASLAAAGLVTVAGVLVIAAARFGVRTITASCVLAAAVLVGVGLAAHANDGRLSRTVRTSLFAETPSWVERAGARDALLVQTPGANRFDAMLTILMNRSITGAAALGTRAIDTFDGLSTTPARLTPDGRLLWQGKIVTRPVVWSTAGAAVAFDDARSLVYDRTFALAVPSDEVRVASIAQGIRYDGKVSQRGTITAYPTRDGRCSRFTARLSVPQGVPTTTLVVVGADGRSRTATVSSDRPLELSVSAAAEGPRTLRWRTVRLGARVPTPLDATVANARFRSTTVSCEAPTPGR